MMMTGSIALGISVDCTFHFLVLSPRSRAPGSDHRRGRPASAGPFRRTDVRFDAHFQRRHAGLVPEQLLADGPVRLPDGGSDGRVAIGRTGLSAGPVVPDRTSPCSCRGSVRRSRRDSCRNPLAAAASAFHGGIAIPHRQPVESDVGHVSVVAQFEIGSRAESAGTRQASRSVGHFGHDAKTASQEEARPEGHEPTRQEHRRSGDGECATGAGFRRAGECGGQAWPDWWR